jgi:hypothetical protein
MIVLAGGDASAARRVHSGCEMKERQGESPIQRSAPNRSMSMPRVLIVEVIDRVAD